MCSLIVCILKMLFHPLREREHIGPWISGVDEGGLCRGVEDECDGAWRVMFGQQCGGGYWLLRVYV